MGGISENNLFNSLAMHPDDPEILFCLSDNILYKTINGGQYWSEISQASDLISFGDIIIDPQNADNMYTFYFDKGVFISRNGGYTWSPSNQDLPDLRVRCLEISPTNPNIVYIGIGSGSEGFGIWKSEDNGLSWENTSNEIGNKTVYTIAVDEFNNDYIYASTYPSGFWLSKDSGESWKEIQSTVATEWFWRIELYRENEAANTTKVFGGLRGGGLYTTTISEEQAQIMISGRIMDGNNAGIQNVLVTFSDLGTTYTNSEGYYFYYVPHGWTGTVMPELSGYLFEPSFRSYNNLVEELLTEDYTGSRQVIQAPINIIAEELSSTKIRVKWTDQSDNEEGFEIQYQAQYELGWKTTEKNASSNTTEFIIANLEPGQIYFFRIRAFNNAIGFSEYSNIAMATTECVRATWLYRLSKRNDRDVILEHLDNWGYNTIYLSADTLWRDRDNNEDIYRSFVQKACLEKHLDVHAMVLQDTVFIHHRKWDEARRHVQTILQINSGWAEGERFSGVHIDVEPHVHTNWIDKKEKDMIKTDWEQNDKLMGWYIGLLKKLKEINWDNTEFSAALAYWYHDQAGQENLTRCEASSLAEHLDVLVYMCYNDPGSFPIGGTTVNILKGHDIYPGLLEEELKNELPKRIIVGLATYEYQNLIRLHDSMQYFDDHATDPAMVNYRGTANFEYDYLIKEQPVMYHTPVEEAKYGTEITLSATITTDEHNLAVPKLFFRSLGSVDFISIYMDQELGPYYSYQIPAESVTGYGIQYYFEASNSKRTVYAPLHAPGNLYTINFRGKTATKVISSQILGENNVYNDPAESLNYPDNNFVSLGVNGWIILELDKRVEYLTNKSLRVHEQKSGSLTFANSFNVVVDTLEEGFEAYVSDDLFSWLSLGKGFGTFEFSLASVGLDSVKYIRIVDDGDGDPSITSPGYDLDAIEVYETTPTKIHNHEVVVHSSYLLSQNYPNPFNPETKIKYQIPKSIHVTINIFNTLGQNICCLVDEIKDEGSYIVSWDGRDNFGHRVTSGVYFFKLKTSEFVTTKKMIIIE